MKNIFTIFKKELLEITRDRKTMTFMLVIPIFIYPALFTGISKYISSQTEKAEQDILRIGLIQSGGQNDFMQFIDAQPKVEIVQLKNDTTYAKDLIAKDSIDVAYYFDPQFDSAFANLQPTSFSYYYTSTNNEFQVAIIEQINMVYQKSLTRKKLEELKVNEVVLEPAKSISRNIASAREQWGSVIGGMIPYFFMIFCLIGCMYPAIDLAAGEKERGTLETLLVSAASRLDIYIGKFLAVALSGFITAIAAIIGLAISANLIGADAGSGTSELSGISELLNGMIEPKSVILLLSILLPLNVFFAAITLMLSIYAKSFKEAQSMITPLMIIIVFPAIIGMLPGVKLDNLTALIPILNVSLAAKEVIAGNVETIPMVLTLLSLFVYAFFALIISVRFFNNEKNIMRG